MAKALRINLEAFEEVVHALKEIDENIMARAHILCGLPNIGIKMRRKRNGEVRTARRMPMPVKTGFACGKA
jgi:hypothetical protein